MTAERSLFATFLAPYVEANPVLVALKPELVNLSDELALSMVFECLVLKQVPPSLLAQMFTFLGPFSVALWIGILVAFILTAISFFLIGDFAQLLE